MSQNLIGADETLFRIVETLAKTGPMGVTEVARQLDLTKSTAHRHLQTLDANGYAINDDGTYRLSHQWFHLGSVVKSRGPFYHASRKPLEALARRTDDTVWGSIEEGGQVMIVNGAGPHPTHNPDLLIGDWLPITKTASGKAMLARMSPARAIDLIEQSDNRERSLADIQTELEYTRSRGYAVNQGEHISGIYAIGMAVTVEDTIYGGLALSSPSDALVTDRRDSAVASLSHAVDRIESKLAQ